MNKAHVVTLMPSLMAELEKAAASEHVEINQYTNIAVAEKLATRRTAKLFFAERAKQSDVNCALELLEQAGLEDEMEPECDDLLIFKRYLRRRHWFVTCSETFEREGKPKPYEELGFYSKSERDKEYSVKI